MVCVENIDLETLVRHCEPVQANAPHVTLHSPRSRARVSRWWPDTVDVTRHMRVQPSMRALLNFKAQCHLVRTITVKPPNRPLAAAALMTGLGGPFLRQRLAEEDAALALDIERRTASLTGTSQTQSVPGRCVEH